MGDATLTRIGYIRNFSGEGRFAGLQGFVPASVEIEVVGLGPVGVEPLYGTKRVSLLLEQAREGVELRHWQGVIASGAPLEIVNPDVQDLLQTAVSVPTTTALTACTAALRALGAQRVLLLTPFDEETNRELRARLSARQIDSVTAPDAFASVADVRALSAEEVERLALRALAEVDDVQAIYFQGAVLDPLKVIDKIEAQARLPVVASNQAMLWFILSRLGQTHSIQGYGALLREWPVLPK